MENKKILIGMPIVQNINYNVVASIINNISATITLGMQAGSLVYDARHKIVQNFLENKQFDYLYFWDSDTTIPRGTIKMLMEHDKDVISVCYYTKQPPYQPVFFKERIVEANGKIGFKYILNNNFLIDKDEGGNIKLQKAIMVGLGGCLIKRKVLEDISKKQKNMFYPQYGLGEDATFCEHVAKAGYDIWVDPSITIGHLGWKEYSYKDYIAILQEKGHEIQDKELYAQHVDF